MAKISVVLSVVDEEVNLLPRAISSVKDLADEIVIVDQTQKGLSLPYSIYKHGRVEFVELVRNFGISKARNEWILILDPDEEISLSLSISLRKIAQESKADYYRIPRKNIIFGKWMKHSRWWPDYNIRFFKKGFVSWDEIIHKVPITSGKGQDLPAKENLAIIHYHYDSIEQFIERMNRYTSQHAKLLVKDSYQFSWRDLIIRPMNEFLSRYFFGEGYKDGLHGLALSLLQGVSELVVYLKIWQAEKFKEQNPEIKEAIKTMKKAESDLHYWQADAMIREGGGILLRIRRKFKI